MSRAAAACGAGYRGVDWQQRADVVVIGSGMGGATFAYGLAQRGMDVLVLERGHRLPKEPENTSPEAVFVDRRYKPDELESLVRLDETLGEDFSRSALRVSGVMCGTLLTISRGRLSASRLSS